MMNRLLLSVFVAACLSGTLPATGQLLEQSRVEKQSRVVAGGFLRAAAVPSVPQSAAAQEKNPWLALGLSTVITGAGQVYNEQIEKGVIMFAGGAAGYLILFAGDSPGSGRAYAGWTLLLGTKLWSMIDAPMTANRINRQTGAASLQIIPLVTPGFAGARLAWRF